MTASRPWLPFVLLMASFSATAYPLWDGAESVADYARRAGIVNVAIELDLGGGVNLPLTLIPAGRFRMGSPENESGRAANEGPAHDVLLSMPFYLGVYEVTQEQAERMKRKSPKTPLLEKDRQAAVNYISWNEATNFCGKVSDRTGWTVTLPTEAQWEWACRAGSTGAFFFGEDPERLGDYAWFAGNDADGQGGEYRTRPVGQKKPNPWGLHDIYGNAREWCLDRYAATAYTADAATDPLGPASGETAGPGGSPFAEKHAARGGTAQDLSCRSAARGGRDSLHHYPFYGFRVAAQLPSPEQVARPRPAPPPQAPPRPPPAVAYPLWDGTETPAAYAGRAGITQAVLTVDLGGEVTLKLALVPAGTFRMGSPPNEPDRCADEGPARAVTLRRPYYIGVFEVTKEQLAQVTERKKKEAAPAWTFDSELQNLSGKPPVPPPQASPPARTPPPVPAEAVGWAAAADFCRKLSARTGLPFRLPTEAEWEYACRAGGSTRFYFGDDIGSVDDYAWHQNNSGGGPRPVGLKTPNAWGLHDMSGNQWEWCADGWGDSYDGAEGEDPAGPLTGSSRVLRGGSWAYGPLVCRTAYRLAAEPDAYNRAIGFRVVMDLPEDEDLKRTGRARGLTRKKE